MKNNRNITYVQKYDSKKFSYRNLVSKNNFKVLNYKLFDLNDISKSKLMMIAKKNALLYGAENRDGNSFVITNKDINKKILVNRQGLTHSKGKISNKKRNVIFNSAELLSNAILINEGYRSGKYTSIFFNEFNFDGESYIARFVVYDNDLLEFESFRLNSLGVNKNGNRPAIDAVATISTISIKQLLEDVNSINESNYKDVLPLNVLYKLNGKEYCVRSSDIEGLKY